MHPTFKPYKKEASYSYTLGIFPTIELVQHQPQQVAMLIFSEDSSISPAVATLQATCRKLSIPYSINDKQLRRLAKNANVPVVGIYNKYQESLSTNSHIVLVEPDDMGNIGTIMRTMLGLGYRDLAIIGASADTWHPKTIRASMGALFQLRIAHFETIQAYRAQNTTHQLFPFMLQGAQPLQAIAFPQTHSLIFGNEGAGLPAAYAALGTAVRIEQDEAIDSLNLAIAASIAMYTANTKAL